MRERKIEILQLNHLHLPFTLLILFCIFHIIITILEHMLSSLGV